MKEDLQLLIPCNELMTLLFEVAGKAGVVYPQTSNHAGQLARSS